MAWRLAKTTDRLALDIYDGLGDFSEHGPHYSRRTVGGHRVMGPGRQVVLLHESGKALWTVIYQRPPASKIPGLMLWRNTVFRNLGAGLSSDLIRSATDATYREWFARYGELPPARLRSEVDRSHIKSVNPGYCYKLAGWTHERTVRNLLHFYAPARDGI